MHPDTQRVHHLELTVKQRDRRIRELEQRVAELESLVARLEPRDIFTGYPLTVEP